MSGGRGHRRSIGAEGRPCGVGRRLLCGDPLRRSKRFEDAPGGTGQRGEVFGRFGVLQVMKGDAAGPMPFLRGRLGVVLREFRAQEGR
jgi:hypothetical protein